ncbi:MAG TPA: GNAT family N-acetyltransferase [Leptospiraceae bacterium]|nr:GNAT family N-acetyltransferase [Leptospiraceae bacterium]HMW06399.1 GNAT family N-acetyltransferase [Leptospiraceae bacterium]HMX31689.1 GNAT family N-acetyltransferase [Leptospiraceae bacterium]HMY31975.1 GNAT family N-acetyltransferase [Leptospiraceae bacterium]HMZ63161.1 GNAT family N-acetyltransferase [Leptospiraceae bacterium]
MIVVRDIVSKEELDIAFSIRKKVFVEEQKVLLSEEYDEFEDESIHILAYYQDSPVGTARMRKTDKGIKLERFSVLRDYRKLGIGSALVKNLLTKCLNELESNVYLYAQLSALTFYQKHGFIAKGEIFLDAGIEHIEMELNKKA